MRPTANSRPTLIDFGAMLADSAREYGIICNPDNSINVRETADNVITALAGITEELAGFYINADNLGALMAVVHEYAVTACTIDRQGKANRAHEALKAFTALYNLVTHYRPELLQYSSAASAYDRAQCLAYADEHRREEESEPGQPGAATFTDECAAATDEPDTTASPTQYTETHDPEFITDSTPKQ